MFTALVLLLYAISLATEDSPRTAPQRQESCGGDSGQMPAGGQTPTLSPKSPSIKPQKAMVEVHHLRIYFASCHGHGQGHGEEGEARGPWLATRCDAAEGD